VARSVGELEPDGASDPERCIIAPAAQAAGTSLATASSVPMAWQARRQRRTRLCRSPSTNGAIAMSSSQEPDQQSRRLEARARRAAKRIGLKARKSRWRAVSLDNHGDFMMIDPDGNWVVAGSRFDMTAEDVIANARAPSPAGSRCP
jgi:hypothetical protein